MGIPINLKRENKTHSMCGPGIRSQDLNKTHDGDNWQAKRIAEQMIYH